MAVISKLELTPAPVTDPKDWLTPAELAKKLKTSESWIFDQCRTRTRKRAEIPIPVHRMGRFLRFYWPEVSAWLLENRD